MYKNGTRYYEGATHDKKSLPPAALNDYTWDESFGPNSRDIHATVVESPQLNVDRVRPVDVYSFNQL